MMIKSLKHNNNYYFMIMFNKFTSSVCFLTEYKKFKYLIFFIPLKVICYQLINKINLLLIGSI